MAYDLNGQQAAAQQGQTQSAFGGITQAVNGGQSVYNPLTGSSVPQGQGPVQKTQDESVAPGGGQSAGAPNQAAPDLSKNVGLNRQDINNTDFLNKAKGQVQSIGDHLQSEADAYTGKTGSYTDPSGKVYASMNLTTPPTYSQTTFDSAVDGDPAAMAAATKFYDPVTAPPSAIPDFSGISTEINGLNGLQTDAGREAAFRKQSGDPANYTAGDGTFDNLVLKNDPAFRQAMADITKGQGDLVQKQADLTKQVPIDIQNAYSKDHDRYAADADAYLASKQKAIQDAIAKQYADAQGAVPGQLSGYQTNVQSSIDNAEAPFKQILAKGPNDGASNAIANLEKMRSPDYINQQHLYGASPLSGNANDYATGTQASQFNNILKLLAHGGAVDPSKTLSPTQSNGLQNPTYYDINKLGDLIKAAIGSGATPDAQPTPTPVTTGGGGGGGTGGGGGGGTSTPQDNIQGIGPIVTPTTAQTPQEKQNTVNEEQKQGVGITTSAPPTGNGNKTGTDLPPEIQGVTVTPQVLPPPPLPIPVDTKTVAGGVQPVVDPSKLQDADPAYNVNKGGGAVPPSAIPGAMTAPNIGSLGGGMNIGGGGFGGGLMGSYGGAPYGGGGSDMGGGGSGVGGGGKAG